MSSCLSTRKITEAYMRILESFSITKESFGFGENSNFVPTNDWGVKLYSKLNMAYFGGRLPSIPVICENFTTDRRTYAFAHYEFGFDRKTLRNFKIRINTLYHCTESEWADTLIHEMIHILDYVTHPEHYTVDENYKCHGAWFQSEGAKVNEVGWHVSTYGREGTNEFVDDRQRKRIEKINKATEIADRKRLKISEEYEKRKIKFAKIIASGRKLPMISIAFGDEIKRPFYGRCTSDAVSVMDSIWRNELFNDGIKNATVRYYYITDPWWGTKEIDYNMPFSHVFNVGANPTADDIKKEIIDNTEYSKDFGRTIQTWNTGKFPIDFDSSKPARVLEWTEEEYASNAETIIESFDKQYETIFNGILCNSIETSFGMYNTTNYMTIGSNEYAHVNTRFMTGVPIGYSEVILEGINKVTFCIDGNTLLKCDDDTKTMMKMVIKRGSKIAGTMKIEYGVDAVNYIIDSIRKGVVPSYEKRVHKVYGTISELGMRYGGIIYSDNDGRGSYHIEEEFVETEVDLTGLQKPLADMMEKIRSIVPSLVAKMKEEFMKFKKLENANESVITEDVDEDDYDIHEHTIDDYARHLYDKHVKDGDMVTIRKIDDNTLDVGIY